MNTLFVKLLNIVLGIISLATSRRYATLSSEDCKSDCSNDVLLMKWSGVQVILVCIIGISILLLIDSIFSNPPWRTSSIPHDRREIHCNFYVLMGLTQILSGAFMIDGSIHTRMRDLHGPVNTTVMPITVITTTVITTTVENSISRDPEIQAKYNYGQNVTAGVIAIFNGFLNIYLGCYVFWNSM